ncbi:hypothetical protein [Microcoleus sp. PH2017_02_FOX_O_A]|nr:hypothetical protein [Microcoleus sp. PH2017_02_FOX_O_A]
MLRPLQNPDSPKNIYAALPDICGLPAFKNASISLLGMIIK